MDALDCLLETNVSHQEISDYLGLSLHAVVQRHRALCQSLCIPTQYESQPEPFQSGELPLPSCLNRSANLCAVI